MDEARAEALLRRLPAAVVADLGPVELEDLRAALARPSGIDHPVDIRLSVPLPWGRRYVALVSGRERRGPERRAVERRNRPLATLGNALFVDFAAGILSSSALVLLLVLSAAVEF